MDSEGKYVYALFDVSSSFYSEVARQLDTRAPQSWNCKCKVEEEKHISDPIGLNLVLAHRNKLPFKTIGQFNLNFSVFC